MNESFPDISEILILRSGSAACSGASSIVSVSLWVSLCSVSEVAVAGGDVGGSSSTGFGDGETPRPRSLSEAVRVD